jgi:hypothetical protein
MRYSEVMEDVMLKDTSDGSNKDFLRRSGQEIAQMINRDCQPFLSKAGGETAWRGIMTYDHNALVQKKDIRVDRAPMSSDGRYHELYNRVFADMGFSTNRSNGMFCTGAYKIAFQYGVAHAVFPIGDFDFLWSPDVRDMFNHFQDSWPNFWKDVEGEEAGEPDFEAIEEAIRASYRENDNLVAAIKSGNEIMVRGTGYYAVREGFWERYVVGALYG